MNPVELTVLLIIGLLAGWLAARILFGRGHGLVANLLVGLMGGVLGGFAVDRWLPSFDASLPGELLVAFLGAVALLTVLGVVRKVAA